MLDNQAIDVGDVKRAVRPRPEHGGPEPVVTRSEKLAVLFVRRATALEGDAIGFENFTMDHILGRFADEDAGLEIDAE